MKKYVFLISLLAALTLTLTSAKKDEKAAPAAQPQHRPSALSEDQIARKKAILNFKMVFVEGGSFTMGCTAEQEDECLLPKVRRSERFHAYMYMRLYHPDHLPNVLKYLHQDH